MDWVDIITLLMSAASIVISVAILIERHKQRRPKVSVTERLREAAKRNDFRPI